MPPKVVVLCQRQFEDFRNQMEEAQSGQIRLCLVTGEAGIGGDPADLLSVQPTLSRYFSQSPSSGVRLAFSSSFPSRCFFSLALVVVLVGSCCEWMVD